MTTLAEVETTTGRKCYDWLEREIEIPVLGGIQCQGDLIVIPHKGRIHVSATKVPAQGVTVLPGQHDHVLVGEGIEWFPAAGGGGTLTLGYVTVPTVAYLLHPEHGANGLAPGTYELRRQRELVQEERMVRD